MAWNTPGNNDPKDPWKDNKSSGSDFEKRINEFFEKFIGNGKSSGSSSILFLLGGLFLLWFVAGVYIVDEKEQGVVLRLGKFHETVGSGLHWNPRLLDQVRIFNSTEVQSFNRKYSMLTKDENVVDVELTIQYQIAIPRDYWLELRDPDGSLADATESALRHVVGTSKMDKILTDGKELVASEVKRRLQNYLDKYKSGLKVSTVNVGETKPPEQVRAAFEDVVNARENQRQIKNQSEVYFNSVVPEAEGQAKRIIEDAKAYRGKIIAEAEGEANRFDQLLIEYRKAPRVTRERLYIESLESVLDQSTKVLVDVKGGNNMMYLPLDKILENKPSAARANTVSELKQMAQKKLPAENYLPRSQRVRETR